MWREVGHESSARVPVRSGRAYRVESPPEASRVTPTLAAELEKVLTHFAVEAGFTDQNPVGILFRPGVVGHHKVGRAADIYEVGGIGLDKWKKRWDSTLARARVASTQEESHALLAKEERGNLGWRLYKAIQCYGRWSQPYGYPVQVFGPWTRSEGPWKFISDRLLYAHRDHIHVAK